MSNNPKEQFLLDDAFTVLDEYFETNGLVRQQVDSFNNFIDHSMQAVIDEARSISIEYPRKFASATRPSHVPPSAMRMLSLRFGQLSLETHITVPGQPNQVITPHIAR
mgnify:CR=1 FL=1